MSPEPITLDELGLRLGHSIIPPTGGGSAGLQEASLASQANAGVSTITVDHSSPVLLTGRTSLLIIDPGSTSTELRAVAGPPAGAVVTLDRPLVNTHAANARVIAWGSPHIPTHIFGCKADGSTDDESGLQAGINECRLAGVYLQGYGKTHLTSMPLFPATGADLRHLTIKAKVGYAPADLTNAMIVSCQDNPIAFTALASNDTFTTPSAHGIGGVPNRVAFKGASLPAPLVQGRLYSVKSMPNGTSLTVAACTIVVGANALDSGTINVGDTTGFATSGSAVINGIAVTYTGKTGTTLTGCGSHAAYLGWEDVVAPNTLDLTSDGSGTLYPDVNALERLYLDDVTIDGNAIAGVNGISNSCQQPQMWRKVRVNSCLGYGVAIAGQDGEFDNLEMISCNVGLKIGMVMGQKVGCSMMKIRDLNIENSAVEAVTFITGVRITIDGFHGEANPSTFHAPSGGEMVGVLFLNPHISYTADAHPGWWLESGSNSTAYQIVGHKPYSASGTTPIIDDTAKGAQLLFNQLADTAYAGTIGFFVQKGGPTFGTVLDNVPKTLTVRTSAPGLGSIAANTTASFTATLTGADSTMAVSASPEGTVGTAFVWSARVSAADTIEIRVANITTGAATPTDRNWRVVAQQAG